MQVVRDINMDLFGNPDSFDSALVQFPPGARAGDAISNPIIFFRELSELRSVLFEVEQIRSSKEDVVQHICWNIRVLRGFLLCAASATPP